MNPTSIFSKTGKGVQEAGGKTSHLSRADRAVLSATDGKTQMAEMAIKFEKIMPDQFDALIAQLDMDGFIREVSSGAVQAVRKRAPQGPLQNRERRAGSFELSRALQTGGAQSGGRTLFNELSAQLVCNKGATQLRNISVSAG